MPDFTPTDADHHQAHKDDPGEWGDPQPVPAPASRSRRRRLAAMLSVRFLPDEEQAVRQAAAGRGISVSRFLRQAALDRVGLPGLSKSLRMPTQTCSSGVAVCWDDGRVDGGTFVHLHQLQSSS